MEAADTLFVASVSIYEIGQKMSRDYWPGMDRSKLDMLITDDVRHQIIALTPRSPDVPACWIGVIATRSTGSSRPRRSSWMRDWSRAIPRLMAAKARSAFGNAECLSASQPEGLVCPGPQFFSVSPR